MTCISEFQTHTQTHNFLLHCFSHFNKHSQSTDMCTAVGAAMIVKGVGCMSALSRNEAISSADQQRYTCIIMYVVDLSVDLLCEATKKRDSCYLCS